MNESKHTEQTANIQWEMIIEMIDASMELARKLGKHPLAEGCNCIACVNKRKRIVKDSEPEWKYRL